MVQHQETPPILQPVEEYVGEHVEVQEELLDEDEQDNVTDEHLPEVVQEPAPDILLEPEVQEAMPRRSSRHKQQTSLYGNPVSHLVTQHAGTQKTEDGYKRQQIIQLVTTLMDLMYS